MLASKAWKIWGESTTPIIFFYPDLLFSSLKLSSDITKKIFSISTNFEYEDIYFMTKK